MKRLYILVYITFIIIGVAFSKVFYKNRTTNSTLNYQINVNGNSVMSFPSKNDGPFNVNVTCNAGSATWDYGNWNLISLSNLSNNDKCDISFTSVEKTYFYTYINNLTSAGTCYDCSFNTENAKRYVGSDPDNYVWFNNELWRIIGVFNNNLVKIIRNESIGGYAYNKDNKNWWSSNNKPSSLNQLLNIYYLGEGNGENPYNGTDATVSTSDTSKICISYSTNKQLDCDFTNVGIKTGYKEMITSTTWYLREYSWVEDAITAYNNERTNGTIYTYDDIIRDTSWIGKIGLMYPSDYLYSGNTSSSIGWLRKYSNEWTISASSGNGVTAVETHTGNSVFAQADSNASQEIRPALHLSTSVYVINGTGTIDDPYIISL